MNELTLTYPLSIAMGAAAQPSSPSPAAFSPRSTMPWSSAAEIEIDGWRFWRAVVELERFGPTQAQAIAGIVVRRLTSERFLFFDFRFGSQESWFAESCRKGITNRAGLARRRWVPCC